MGWLLDLDCEELLSSIWERTKCRRKRSRR